MVQYGDKNKAEFTWKDEQSKSHLLNLVERIPSRATAVSTLGRVQIKQRVQTFARTHVSSPLSLSACRFRSAFRRANSRLPSQRGKGWCGQGCGDAGD